MDHRHPNKGQSDTRLGFSVRYQIGELLSNQLDPQRVTMQGMLADSRYRSVERNNVITLKYQDIKVPSPDVIITLTEPEVPATSVKLTVPEISAASVAPPPPTPMVPALSEVPAEPTLQAASVKLTLPGISAASVAPPPPPMVPALPEVPAEPTLQAASVKLTLPEISAASVAPPPPPMVSALPEASAGPTLQAASVKLTLPEISAASVAPPPPPPSAASSTDDQRGKVQGTSDSRKDLFADIRAGKKLKKIAPENKTKSGELVQSGGNDRDPIMTILSMHIPEPSGELSVAERAQRRRAAISGSEDSDHSDSEDSFNSFSDEEENT